MARYTTTVATARPTDEVFAYVADFRNAAEWDPGVSSSTIIEGDRPGRGTVYRVSVSAFTLDYTTVAYDEPQRTVLEGVSSLFYSYDTITVETDASGSRVTYDAELRGEGFAKLINPLLGLVFDRIGDRAAAGLAKALDGQIIESSSD